MDSKWGPWTFESELVRNFVQSNFTDEPVNSSLLPGFCLNVNFSSDLDQLNDFSSDIEVFSSKSESDLDSSEPDIESVPDSTEDPVLDKTKKEVKDVKFTTNEITTQLVKSIKLNDDITQIIPLVASAANNDELPAILKSTWEKLTQPTDYDKYISAVSCSSKATQVFCEQLLYLNLLDETAFETISKTVLPFVPKLGSGFVSHCLAPFLTQKPTFIQSNVLVISDILDSLSQDQRVELLKLLIDRMNTEFNQYFIDILSLTISSSCVLVVLPTLIPVLTHHIKMFNKDRALGKLLITIVESLADGDYDDNTVESLQNVVDAYAGITRIKLKSALNQLVRK